MGVGAVYDRVSHYRLRGGNKLIGLRSKTSVIDLTFQLFIQSLGSGFWYKENFLVMVVTMFLSSISLVIHLLTRYRGLLLRSVP